METSRGTPQHAPTSETVAVSVAYLEHVTDTLIADARRLRMRAEPGSSLEHLADRLADLAESLYWTHHACAAELHDDFFCICGDHDLAADEALRTVDAQQRQLLLRLGRDPDRITLTPENPLEAAA